MPEPIDPSPFPAPSPVTWTPRAKWAGVVLLVALALAVGASLPLSDPLPPCPTEDSVSCHWNAGTQGNGVGRSFDSDASGRITYTDGE